MKKFLFLLFVLYAWQVLSAQDKIITASGDTILCRIISVSGNHIVYEQQSDKKQVSGKIISLDNVAEYFRAPATLSSDKVFRSLPPERPWLFSLSAGGGHMPWLLDNVDTENNGYEKLDNGFTLNATVHYLITNHVGFGVNYSFFTSNVKNTNPAMISSFPVYTDSDIRERQYINYAGLSVFFRQYLDNSRKFSLNETLGGGLLLYRAESQSKVFMPDYSSSYLDIYKQYYMQYRYYHQNTLITGNTFGATVGVSAEYKILPYLSAGIGGNFLYGSLSRISGEYKNSVSGAGKLSGEKLENPINLSRIDYFLILRFQL